MHSGFKFRLRSGSVVPIPSFYTSYVNDRTNTIQLLDNEISGHGDSFIFISDLHNENRFYSTPIANHIAANTDTKRIVYGGDYLNEPNSYDLAYNLLVTRTSKFRSGNPDTILLEGNHDTNPYGTGQISEATLQNLLCAGLSNQIQTNGKNYYYVDNESQKIRFIYLDTYENGTIDNDQITFFANAINLTSDWTIVIVSHMAILAGPYNVRNITTTYNVVNQLETLINNSVPTIACWICGHTHIDLINTIRFSFPIIAVTCDAHLIQASLQSSDARAEGTINEQSLNVFHINTQTKCVKLTRIGGGEYNAINDGYNVNDKVFYYT